MKREVRFVPLILAVVIAAVFWFISPPEGVTVQAMRLLGIFIATIFGIIMRALPMGAVAVVGMTATIFTNTLKFEEAFSGFHNQVVWLIVAAFFLARGFTKTGLGNRIAYFFVLVLGKRTLGLGYGILTTEFVLSPVIPSNTARAGGVILPIVESLGQSFGSDPAMGTSRRIGAFLTVVAFQGTCVTSAMFLTAMAPNPLIASFAGTEGVEITWGTWAMAAIVPGLISLICMPLIVYKLYPPTVKSTPNATLYAREKLSEMGNMSGSEWIMAGTFIFLLALWILGKTIGVSATTAALIGLCLLLITGVLTWKDVLKESPAWETLIWFSVLIAMAANLKSLGIIDWLGAQVAAAGAGLHWAVALIFLALIYYYSHYLFASLLAHVVSMYPVFLGVAISLGAPAMPAALIFAFISSLFGGLTHYASGPAAILFGSGYVGVGAWWRLGAIISVLNIISWIGIGSIWWKILGYW